MPTPEAPRRRALVLLAPGFEEIEAVTVVDVLRRAGVDTLLAGLEDGVVEGAHAIGVRAEGALESVDPEERFDVLVLPGGEPGTTHLDACADVHAWIERQHRRGDLVAAICAAPRILAARGDLQGRDAPRHPSVRAGMEAAGVHYREARVVSDAGIVTSRGPGTAIEFALSLVGLLCGETRAADLARAMQVGTREARATGRPAPQPDT